jgi:hypothetical protein
VQQAPGGEPRAQPLAAGNDAGRRGIHINTLVRLAALVVVAGVLQHHVEPAFFGLPQRLGIGIGFDEIVGIDEGQVFAARGVEAGIARRRQAAVLLPDHAHLRQAAGKFGEDARAGIGRAVVHRDDFVGRRRQRGKAFQAARQVGRDVVHRHDDGKGRRTHASFPRFPACQSSKAWCRVAARWA